MEGVIESNLHEIAEAIFSKPPAAPGTHYLGLDEDMDAATQLEVMQSLVLLGMQTKFGHRDIMQLTEPQYFVMKQYILSMGYEMYASCNDGESPWEVAKRGEAITGLQVRFVPTQQYA